MRPARKIKRIAFVSTRIAGTDGVSLEIGKWAEVLEGMGVECCYVAGECDRPPDCSIIIEEAHFEHPLVQEISRRAFGSEMRTPRLSRDILDLSVSLRTRLNRAFRKLKVDAIIVENALTIPMNVPLGVALVQVIMEHGWPCLAHHHDFYWERERFLVNAIDDIIHYAFPPALPQIQHVVINSLAGEEFSRRTGLSCRIIPNIMDYANLPPPPDDYARGFREAIGLTAENNLILQPTRVVARKGIEHSIELIRRLGCERCKLVITHSSGDEGDAYPQRVREFAGFMGVELVFVSDRIAEKRGMDAQGRPLFTMADAYSQADLVSYPSEYEGFGNAFLEAIYYRKPILCNRYAIYRTDIDPLGFKVILFDGFLTAETIAETRRVLSDSAYRASMVENNYQVASEFFSYQVLEQEIQSLMLRPHNIYRTLGRNSYRDSS